MARGRGPAGGGGRRLRGMETHAPPLRCSVDRYTAGGGEQPLSTETRPNGILTIVAFHCWGWHDPSRTAISNFCHRQIGQTDKQTNSKRHQQDTRFHTIPEGDTYESSLSWEKMGCGKLWHKSFRNGGNFTFSGKVKRKTLCGQGNQGKRSKKIGTNH